LFFPQLISPSFFRSRSKVLSRWLAGLPQQLALLGLRNPELSNQLIDIIHSAASRSNKELLQSLQATAARIYGETFMLQHDEFCPIAWQGSCNRWKILVFPGGKGGQGWRSVQPLVIKVEMDFNGIDEKLPLLRTHFWWCCFSPPPWLASLTAHPSLCRQIRWTARWCCCRPRHSGGWCSWCTSCPACRRGCWLGSAAAASWAGCPLSWLPPSSGYCT